MGFKPIIHSSINTAFRQLKDLAIDAVYVRRTGAEFSFETAEVSDGTLTNIPIKTVVLGTKKSGSPTAGHRTSTRQIMLRKSEISDISNFDSVIIDNKTWKLETVVQDTGFVLLVGISREI